MNLRVTCWKCLQDKTNHPVTMKTERQSPDAWLVTCSVCDSKFLVEVNGHK